MPWGFGQVCILNSGVINLFTATFSVRIMIIMMIIMIIIIIIIIIID